MRHVVPPVCGSLYEMWGNRVPMSEVTEMDVEAEDIENTEIIGLLFALTRKL